MMDRRRFFTTSLAAGGGGLLGLGLGKRGLDAAVASARFHPDEMLGEATAGGGPQGLGAWYRYQFIGQPVMDTQLLFWLGLAPNGLSDVGEVLDTGTRITPGDELSWFEAWLDTARRVQGYGEAAEAAGHERSAARHYLRAGAYYRAGLMRYADHADPRILETTDLSLSLHGRALRGLGVHSEELAIPYEDSVLYGRSYFSPRAERAPFIVLHQGLHAWPEDTLWVIDEALARGYHVLSFHGPGQGASLRRHGHPFRPDWEVPVAAVLDLAEADPRFDMDRAVLMGLSFGGYLAPRAAVHEERLYALVADPGVLSWADAMLRHFRAIPGLMALHDRGPEAFNTAISAASLAVPDANWYFADVTWKHGVATPYDVIAELRRYDNVEGAGKIRCKTLIMEGVAEDASPGESQRLYDALSCPKTLMVFDAASAAQTHCQGGGTVLAAARLGDWLDEEVGA